ncbi:MAG: enoyl-CoA hydratase/isomerase family protein [Gemmatimonadetes bacterium]|nr:enoyl-CoA hydratase/isomerase family protein [Gemmatimonadota bacterium]
MSSPLRVERDGGVATLWLNRPDKRNALNGPLVAALAEALDETARDPEVRVVCLRGTGKDFCSGADLAELEAIATQGPLESVEDAQRLGDVLGSLRLHPRPVVAVVHGKALAGGCGLATACDMVLAREDAVFGYPEVHLGFVPAMVLSILRRKVGESRAFELVALGGRIDAEAARDLGLVNRVFATDTFDAEVESALASLAAIPPSALELTKRLFYGVDGLSVDDAIRRGAEVNALARLTDACRAGVRAFLERVRDRSG